MQFSKRTFARSFRGVSRTNHFTQGIEGYKYLIRKTMQDQRVVSTSIKAPSWPDRSKLHLIAIPTRSTETHSKRDYFRNAVEEFQPDVIVSQSDPTNYYNMKKLLGKEFKEETFQVLKNVKSIDDCIIDYDYFDQLLTQHYSEQEEAKRNSEKKEIFEKEKYEYDNILYRDLEPQMMSRLHEYNEAFNAIETQEDIRNHPKMKELKRLHDIVHYTRTMLWGANLEHLHYDMEGNTIRAMVNRNKVALGEYPEILFRRFIDRNFSYKKLKAVYSAVMKICENPDYDDLKGKDEATTLSVSAAYGEFPEIFILPKTLYTAGLIKELIDKNQRVLAFVNSTCYAEVKRRMLDPIFYKQLNMKKYLELKENKRPESDEIRIKKQALLDNLLDNYPWMTDDVLNSIKVDTKEIPQSQQNVLKSVYSTAYSKYLGIRKDVLKFDATNLEKLQKKRESQQEEHQKGSRERKLEKAREF
ncbi:unnamed protein product [Moneuplotes crassus]|uniref:Uncharacterized protein n=1 Tax=Euplotes crassus TaxID=5936 RepID=A0AAD1XDE2_EUPCR|nr:unnamed protein product [Moneuplotes crassus]